MVENRYLIDRVLGFTDVVGHQQNCSAIFSQIADRAPEVSTANRVHVVCGLIQYHGAARSNRCHTEAGQAKYSSRQFIPGLVSPIGNVQSLKKIINLIGYFFVSGSTHLGHQARY